MTTSSTQYRKPKEGLATKKEKEVSTHLFTVRILHTVTHSTHPCIFSFSTSEPAMCVFSFWASQQISFATSAPVYLFGLLLAFQLHYQLGVISIHGKLGYERKVGEIP